MWRKDPAALFERTFARPTAKSHDDGRRWAYRHVFGDYFDESLSPLLAEGDRSARDVLDEVTDLRGAAILTLAWIDPVNLDGPERVAIAGGGNEDAQKNRIIIATVLLIALRTCQELAPNFVTTLQSRLFQTDTTYRFPNLPGRATAAKVRDDFPNDWARLVSHILDLGSVSDPSATVHKRNFTRVLLPTLLHYRAPSQTDEVFPKGKARLNWFNLSASRTRTAQELAHTVVDACLLDRGLGADPRTRLLLGFPYETEVQASGGLAEDLAGLLAESSAWLLDFQDRLEAKDFDDFTAQLAELRAVVDQQHGIELATDSKNARAWRGTVDLLKLVLDEDPDESDLRLTSARQLLTPEASEVTAYAVELLESLRRDADPAVHVPAALSEEELNQAYLLVRAALRNTPSVDPVDADEEA